MHAALAPRSEGDEPTAASADQVSKADSTKRAISGKFLEWLASTGRSQQLLDLIRIDAGAAHTQQNCGL